MNPAPFCIGPETATVEAIRLMREKNLACLPVTRDGKLLGLITDHDLIVVSSHLLEDFLNERSLNSSQ
jgi:CBS domain-containing protein